MATAFNTLPPSVQDLLLQGRYEDAAELLRKSRSISLKGAQTQISSVVAQGLPASRQPQASNHPRSNAEAPATAIEANNLGVGLLQLLSALRRPAPQRGRPAPPRGAEVENVDPSLAPGEQPKSSLSSAVVFALATAALAGLLILLR